MRSIHGQAERNGSVRVGGGPGRFHRRGAQAGHVQVGGVQACLGAGGAAGRAAAQPDDAAGEPDGDRAGLLRPRGDGAGRRDRGGRDGERHADRAARRAACVGAGELRDQPGGPGWWRTSSAEYPDVRCQHGAGRPLRGAGRRGVRRGDPDRVAGGQLRSGRGSWRRAPARSSASPGYLETHGTPTCIEDLSDHTLLHYTNLATGNFWRLRPSRATSGTCASAGG